jgi:hypothetical protein
MRRPADRLEAEGHALIAQGHELLARAAQARAEGTEYQGDPDDLVPLAETALDARTRRRLEREGRLPVVKLGRRKFTSRSALASLVDPAAADGSSCPPEDADARAVARRVYASVDAANGPRRRHVG